MRSLFSYEYYPARPHAREKARGTRLRTPLGGLRGLVGYDIYRLRHRKCDVWIFIHELQNFGKHFLCGNLFIVYIARI